METDNFKLPPLSILDSNCQECFTVSDEEVADNKEKLLSVFKIFGIDIEKIDVCTGSTVSLYSIAIRKLIKKSDYEEIKEYISLAFPYRSRIKRIYEGLEVEISNRTPATLSLKYLLENGVFKNSKAELPVALGVTTDGKVKVADIAEMPHLLIAGAARQGKTNFIKTMIMSLLYSKKTSEVKFVMIDPKMVELSQFSSLPKDRFALADIQDCTKAEYQNPIISAPTDAEKALLSLCAEMGKRYGVLAEANVRDIKTYNTKNPEQVLPYIVLFIDEYADLIIPGFGINTCSMSDNIKNSIISLAQKGSAVGLHVVMTTLRPSPDVMDGLVKTNFPARAVFRVSTRLDSCIILDQAGAEILNAKGDMLYFEGGALERIQCPYVTDDEIERTTDYISMHTKSDGCRYYMLPGKPANEQENASSTNEKDPMFDEIVTFVSKKSQITAANLQRSFGVGYARANRIIDQLCKDGVIVPDNGKYKVYYQGEGKHQV